MKVDKNSAQAAQLRAWRGDILRFVQEVFGVEPDEWQKRVLVDMAHGRLPRTAMKACKNPGKTAVLAWCAWWFLVVYPHPKVIATSISGDNLDDGLWTEMAKWQNASPLLKAKFTWTASKIASNDHPETWYMVARTWKKDANPEQQAETLAGKHADYILFILDEVGGIPQAVMVAAEAALGSGIVSRLLIAGNPTRLEGPLYRACNEDRALWNLHEITGDPDDPNRAPRVDKAWAQQQIDSYGRENPWVMANVLGQFPPNSINTLLGPEDVAKAMRRHLRVEEYGFAQKRMGIDVADEGDDRTVIFPRQGLVAFTPAIMRNAKGPDIAARVIAAKHKWGSELELIDDTGGWAGSAQDFVITAGHALMPVNFAGKATDPRYENARAEMWFEMAEWVKRGGVLPNIPDLVAELTTTTYTFTPKGRFILEPKKLVKKRLKRSPDLADALALTFAIPEAPTDDISKMFPHVAARRRKAVIDEELEEIRFHDQGAGVGRVAIDSDPFPES